MYNHEGSSKVPVDDIVDEKIVKAGTGKVDEEPGCQVTIVMIKVVPRGRDGHCAGCKGGSSA